MRSESLARVGARLPAGSKPEKSNISTTLPMMVSALIMQTMPGVSCAWPVCAGATAKSP